jgi:hypothetical protein
VEHFVTILDSAFLPQGLALHRSLQKLMEDFRLWVICVDEGASCAVTAMSDVTIEAISAADFEDETLRDLRRQRTVGEYCWTLTPIAPKVVFEREPAATRVTYLDADMYALAPLAPIFDEFERSGRSVLITEHAYAPEHDMAAISGRFCVQFVTFVRDDSEVVRQWWEDRCIEWCFNRAVEGRFGDQMYLDDWPERFPDHVHVLERRSAMLAPWNATRFPLSEAILYHFHQLRTTKYGPFDVGSYPLPGPLWRDAYVPYVALLRQIIFELRRAGFTVRPQKSRASARRRAKRLLRSFWRT